MGQFLEDGNCLSSLWWWLPKYLRSYKFVKTNQNMHVRFVYLLYVNDALILQIDQDQPSEIKILQCSSFLCQLIKKNNTLMKSLLSSKSSYCFFGFLTKSKYLLWFTRGAWSSLFPLHTQLSLTLMVTSSQTPWLEQSRSFALPLPSL